MAAKPKPDGPRSSSVRRRDFDRLVENCENAPKAGERLKTFVEMGRNLVISQH